MKQGLKAASALVEIPWSAFVGAFLYYVLLAAVALAGTSPSTAVVATAYLAPAVAYGVLVLGRASGAMAQLLRIRPLRAARGL